MNPPRRPRDPSDPLEDEPFVSDMSEGAETGLYLALLELLDEGLIITGDETILEVNSAACRLLQRDYRQLAGRPLADIFPSERAFLDARARLFIQGEMRGSLQLSMPDGGHRMLRFVAAARIRPGIHALIISPDLLAETRDDDRQEPATRDTLWPRLAAALDQAVLVLDDDERVMAANAAALRVLGTAREHLVGHPLSGHARVEWPQDGAQPWARLDTGAGMQAARVLPGPRPDWRLLVLPVATPAAPVVSAQDTRFRRAFEGSPLPSLLCEADSGRVADANRAAADTYGYPLDTLRGLGLDTLRADEHPGRPESGMWTLRRADGDTFEAEVLVFPLNASDGELLALIHDLPEHPLLSSRGRLPTSTFDSFSQALLITDSDNRILTVNPAFTALTGYSRDEVIGQDPRLLASGHHDAAFFAAMWAQIDATGQWQGQIWNRLKDGETQPQWLVIRVVRGRDGHPLHHIGMLSELTRARAVEPVLRTPPATVAQVATGSELDPSAERARLATAFEQAAEHARRLETPLVVAHLDLGTLPALAASHGHDLARQLLALARQRIEPLLPAGSSLALRGDHALALLLPGDAAALDDIATALARPFALGERNWPLAADIGWATFPEHGTHLDTLLDHAAEAAAAPPDTAGDKATPRPPRPYLAAHDSRALEARLLAAALTRARDRDELDVRLAPIADTGRSGPVDGEAMLYWRHPDLGLIPSERLWPVAAQLGLETELRDHLLARACAAAAHWPGGGPRLLIALSIEQAGHERFVERVAGLLREHELPARLLLLSLPGAALTAPSARLSANLLQLAQSGVRLVIEDFGLAALAPIQLKRHAFSGARLAPALGDGSLADGDALVAAMAGLATALNLELSARAVPTPARASTLAALGCPRHSGPAAGLALSADDFVALLRA